MAVDVKPISELLKTLTDAVTSATTAFPTDETAFLPPKDGISLLDVKNDLLLSYIQHLVFLIILKLRNLNSSEQENTNSIGSEVIHKLIELRVYLERGVRPLEGRLRYQIDKVLRAAEDADRTAVQKASKAKAVNGEKKKSRKQDDSSAESNTDSEVSQGDASSSEEDDDDDDDDDDVEIDEQNYRPNTAALARAAAASADKQQPTTGNNTRTVTSSGAYKPPRITPTAMPNSTPTSQDAPRADRRRRSHHLLSEYIDDEMSTAPTAQPSIGSNNTILARGRSGMSTRDRAKERERTEYEERNFTRLPAESKKERRKARLREGNNRDMFGGEDWTGLGGLGDRISRSVGSSGKGDGGMSVLQRREERKRKREQQGQDGPRGSGMGASIGDSFEKRRKVLQDRAERKMNKRR